LKEYNQAARVISSIIAQNDFSTIIRFPSKKGDQVIEQFQQLRLTAGSPMPPDAIHRWMLLLWLAHCQSLSATEILLKKLTESPSLSPIDVANVLLHQTPENQTLFTLISKTYLPLLPAFDVFFFMRLQAFLFPSIGSSWLHKVCQKDWLTILTLLLEPDVTPTKIYAGQQRLAPYYSFSKTVRDYRDKSMQLLTLIKQKHYQSGLIFYYQYCNAQRNQVSTNNEESTFIQQVLKIFSPLKESLLEALSQPAQPLPPEDKYDEVKRVSETPVDVKIAGKARPHVWSMQSSESKHRRGHSLRTKSPVPDVFLCPITKAIMRDPVLLSDGYTYEHEAIIRWLKNNDTSPRTSQRLDKFSFTRNIGLKKQIDTFIQSSGLDIPEAESNIPGNVMLCNEDLRKGDILLKHADDSLVNKMIILGTIIHKRVYKETALNQDITHAGICIKNGENIAEASGGGLTMRHLPTNDHYNWEVFRYEKNPETAALAADLANSLVLECQQDKPTWTASSGTYNIGSAAKSAVKTNPERISPEQRDTITQIVNVFQLSKTTYYCSNFVVFVYALACEILKPEQEKLTTFIIEKDYNIILPAKLYQYLQQHKDWQHLGYLDNRIKDTKGTLYPNFPRPEPRFEIHADMPDETRQELNEKMSLSETKDLSPLSNGLLLRKSIPPSVSNTETEQTSKKVDTVHENPQRLRARCTCTDFFNSPAKIAVTAIGAIVVSAGAAYSYS